MNECQVKVLKYLDDWNCFYIILCESQLKHIIFLDLIYEVFSSQYLVLSAVVCLREIQRHYSCVVIAKESDERRIRQDNEES